MNVIVRTAVVALALTGSAAYINLSTASAKPTLVQTNVMPVPTCPPNGKTDCGMSNTN